MRLSVTYGNNMELGGPAVVLKKQALEGIDFIHLMV
jgi:hypothetical protein